MNAQVWIAILVGLAATVDDLARRQIANWIPAAALAGGFGWQIGQHGGGAGCTRWAARRRDSRVFLIFYLLGGMGGGDVKLMAGFGALLGAGRLLKRRCGPRASADCWRWVWLACQFAARRQFAAAAATAAERERADSIPYAPAIALGVWLSLVPKG